MLSAALLLTLAIAGTNPDAEAARLDRERLPLADQPYAYYLSLSSQRSPEARERLVKVVRSTLPAYSSKAYLPDQLPVRVNDTLLRIDTRGLGWEHSLPYVLAVYYPYRPDLRIKSHQYPHGQHSRTFDAAWFVANIPDGKQTGDAQFRLLYNNKPPKNTKEMRAFWKVNEDPNFLFQFHEALSGVGVNPDRNVKQFDTATRGGLYATEDSENPVGEKDPGQYGKALKFDAGEEIPLIPKQMNGENAVALSWWLANGKGERQFVAPAAIVTDHNKLRSTEIGLGSCRACHIEGLRPLNINGFAEYLSGGARVAADKKTQQLIDQQYQSGMAQQIEADNKLYAKYLELCNGYTPAQDAKAYEAVVRAYDAPVTRAQAARELYMSEDEFKQALGYYSAKYSLPRRLAQLAGDEKAAIPNGVPISRGQWVQDFPTAWVAKQKWEAR